MPFRRMDISMNLMTFHSKLDEFRNNGKYCDTVIEVEGKSFNCHRLALTMASEYFDMMLGGNFSESKSSHIILKDLDALAFQEVLRFFYTGEAVITQENIFGVLRASDFFKLDGLQEFCNQFIDEHQRNLSSSLPQIFEILSFLCLTRNKLLISIISEYIMENFDIFAGDDEFFKLSFEALNILISLHWHLSAKNSEPFLSVVFAWLDHNDTTTGRYREELMGKIELQYILANCRSRRLGKIKLQYISANSRSRRSSKEKYPDFGISKKRIPDLHVYLNICSEQYDESQSRVYSIKRNNLQWKSLLLMTDNKFESLGCIEFGNYLYCLSEEPVTEGDSNSIYDFTACPSVDVCDDSYSNRQLRSPPGLLAANYVSMCSINDYIYLSNAAKSRSKIKRAVNASILDFSRQEITQGIYAYNTNTDQWFPIPLLKREMNIQDNVAKPITAINDTLYLIKKDSNAHLKSPNNFNETTLSIFALDHRVANWQELTKFHCDSTLLSIDEDIACCAHEGKIYVASSFFEEYGTSEVEVSRYDLVANKWEKVVKIIEKPSSNYQFNSVKKLLSHGSYLWAFGNGTAYQAINVYNSYTQTWGPPPIPELMVTSLDDFSSSTDSKDDFFDGSICTHFLDAVAFNKNRKY